MAPAVTFMVLGLTGVPTIFDIPFFDNALDDLAMLGLLLSGLSGLYLILVKVEELIKRQK